MATNVGDVLVGKARGKQGGIGYNIGTGSRTSLESGNQPRYGLAATTDKALD